MDIYSSINLIFWQFKMGQTHLFTGPQRGKEVRLFELRSIKKGLSHFKLLDNDAHP